MKQDMTFLEKKQRVIDILNNSCWIQFDPPTHRSFQNICGIKSQKLKNCEDLKCLNEICPNIRILGTQNLDLRSETLIEINRMNHLESLSIFCKTSQFDQLSNLHFLKQLIFGSYDDTYYQGEQDALYHIAIIFPNIQKLALYSKTFSFWRYDNITLDSVEMIKGMEYLESLKLNDIYIPKSVIQHICSSFQRLKQLSFGNCPIFHNMSQKQIQQLAKSFKKLEKFYSYYPYKQSKSSQLMLSNIPKLKTLGISNFAGNSHQARPIQQLISQYQSLLQSVSLYIQEPKIIDFSILIKSLQLISQLQIRFKNISFAEIKPQLKNLKMFREVLTKVQQPYISLICTFKPKLVDLKLTGYVLSDAQIRLISFSLIMLKRLQINDTQISNSCLCYFSKLRYLKVLRLLFKDIRAIRFSKGLYNLKDLDVFQVKAKNTNSRMKCHIQRSWDWTSALRFFE